MFGFFRNGVITIRLPWAKKEPKKRNIIMDIFENPEQYVLHAYVENDEVNIKIRKK